MSSDGRETAVIGLKELVERSSDNLAMFMYSETFFKLQVGYGAAIAVALFLLAAIVILLYFRQSRAAERLYG